MSRFSAGGLITTLRGKGRIEFTDDDTNVKTLAPGGFFEIEQSRGWFSWRGPTRFSARAASDATISRTFAIDGKTASEDEGRRWLKTILPTLIRHTGIGAKARVARILRQSGPDGVLREIEQISGSWAKGVYFQQLFEQARLDTPTLARALDRAGRDIESDFELRMTLQHAAGRVTLDSTAGTAYANAARSIDSDFEQRHALGSAFLQPGLSPDVAGALLKVAATGIDSDFELAELLIHVPPTTIAGVMGPYFEAVHTIGSDFERRRVLTTVAGRPGLIDADIAAIARSVQDMGSDFERAETLLAVITHQRLSSAARDAVLAAARGIGSDHERGRVLSAMLREGALTSAAK